MQNPFDIWELLAGIALFLFAMTQLELALKTLGGRSLSLYLREKTSKRFNAVLGGVIATALLQSSSVVGLMVLAFTGAGLLILPSALGIVFGANLGTTLTGWIVATLGFKFEIFELALPLIAIGGAAVLFGRGRWPEGGRAVLGLGLLLLALQFMKNSVAGLEQFVSIEDLAGFAPWQYLLFGVVVAAVIQSSSATITITLAALNANIISLDNAVAVVIGADLGTTTTVLLGAIKGSADKQRVAAGQVIFNVVTDIIAFTIRLPLLSLVGWVGIKDPLFSLVAFHSFFNLLGLCIFLPLTKPFATFLERIIKNKDSREARYLTDVSPAVTDAALAAIQREIARLIARVIRLTCTAFPRPLHSPTGQIPVVYEPKNAAPREQSFDELYHLSKTLEGEILEFVFRLQDGTREQADSQRLAQMLNAARWAMRSAKAIKDIHHNLQEFSGLSSSTVRREQHSYDKRKEDSYEERFHAEMQNFITALFDLRPPDTETIDFETLVAMIAEVFRCHDNIHNNIVEDVRSGKVSETLVSTLLNVNHELLNCQLWMVFALGNFHLPELQANDLEQVTPELKRIF